MTFCAVKGCNSQAKYLRILEAPKLEFTHANPQISFGLCEKHDNLIWRFKCSIKVEEEKPHGG